MKRGSQPPDSLIPDSLIPDVLKTDLPTSDQPTNPSSTANQLSDRETIFTLGRPLLVLRGESEQDAGRYLGRLIKDCGEAATADAVRAATRDPPVEPKSWLKTAATRNASSGHQRGRPNGASAHRGLSSIDYHAGLAPDGTLL